MIVAAQKSHVRAARRLLRLRPDLNACTSRTGETALHKAAFEGNLEMVNLLLDAGADPSIEDHDGETALRYADKRDFEDVAAVLRTHAMTHAANTDSMSALR